MVLLHHELVVDFPNGRPTENHQGTLLEFGSTRNGKEISTMSLTVGIPVAIGTLVVKDKRYLRLSCSSPMYKVVYMILTTRHLAKLQKHCLNIMSFSCHLRHHPFTTITTATISTTHT